MTRMFLDDWEAQMQSLIAPNTTGDVSAVDFQTVYTNLKDSSIDAEATLGGSAPQLVSIDENWVVLNDALLAGPAMYDTTQGGDGTFLLVDVPAGTITGTSTPGYSYNAVGALSLDAGNNVVIEASIGVNGMPNDNFIGSIIGTGGVRDQSVYVERFTLTALASAAYSLMIRAPAGITNITLANRAFAAIIKPTNDAL